MICFNCEANNGCTICKAGVRPMMLTSGHYGCSYNKITIQKHVRETERAASDKKLRQDLRDCRNELCLKCGNYRQAHHGACDGCRWRTVG